MPGARKADLEGEIDGLVRRFGEAVPIERIAEVVHAVLTSASGELSAADLRLYHELESLAQYISSARAEIAALKPRAIRDDYIPAATDELDAIVAATEKATNDILDAAETIEQITGSLPPEAAQVVTDATTRIYEACNFQDITGQRITKVVKALQHIENEVAGVLTIFGHEGGARATAPKAAPTGEEGLLNGPQLPGAASRQEDVDALLASFD